MKKISVILCAIVMIVVSCNKESGKSTSESPLQVSVTDVSALMQVSYMKSTSNEALDVQYTGEADSIIWWITDSSHSIPAPVDSSVYYPYPHDSVLYPHPDTIYTPPAIPVDSSRFPRDTTFLPPVIPPVDSAGYPRDSTIYPPPPVDSAYYPDSTRKGGPSDKPFASAYSCTINKNHLVMKINLSGNYVINVVAYRKNADGSLTVIKTGFVKVSVQ